MTIQRALRTLPIWSRAALQMSRSQSADVSWIRCQGKTEGVRGPSTNEGPQVLPLKRFVASCSEKGVFKMKRGQTGKLQNKLQVLTTMLKPQSCFTFRCYIFPFNREILQALRSTYHGQVLCRCCGAEGLVEDLDQV